jgi:large subunit ribosomal protein L19
MALTITIKDTEFGIGDRVRVVQKIKEGDKSREAIFEGMVIGIKGREPGKTFLVRRTGEAGIGIERIFPVNLPTISKITIVKSGVKGVKRTKLYYIRNKALTEIETIFKRAALRTKSRGDKSNK